jgi:hypothetical protein
MPEKRSGKFTGNFMAAEIYRFSRFSLQKYLSAFWGRMRRVTLRSEKRLRLCENLPLGERRFVAVVEFENERFLLGGTASSLVLLARLASAAAQTDEALKADDDPVQTRLNALWSAGGSARAASAVSPARGERW